jgi:hypothetical protein
MTLSDEEYLSLNARGLFPAPKESEADFRKRIEANRAFFALCEEHISDRVSDACLKSDFLKISPSGILAFYSNRGLPFWQGAITCIAPVMECLRLLKVPSRERCQEPVCYIQMKKGFKKGSYLGLYSRDEILSHELVHAARLCFHEPKYEEILAFQTSKKHFRRFLGPLFQRSWEAPLLLLPLLLQLFSPLFIMIFLVLFSYAFLRLSYYQFLFSRSRKNVGKIVKEPLAFLLRLSDREITAFARLSPSEIRKKVEDLQESSYRWRILAKAFLSSES